MLATPQLQKVGQCFESAATNHLRQNWISTIAFDEGRLWQNLSILQQMGWVVRVVKGVPWVCGGVLVAMERVVGTFVANGTRGNSVLVLVLVLMVVAFVASAAVVGPL